MKKIKIILIIAVYFVFNFGAQAIGAVKNNPSYGTTTFFAEKNEALEIHPPILDIGVSAGLYKGSDNDDAQKNKQNNNQNQSSTGSLFDKIIGGVGSLLEDDTISQLDTTKNSLFDWQNNFDQGDSNGESSFEEDDFIMGPRGESLENMSAEDIAAYNNRVSKKFNFNNLDNGAKATVKKSKLLLTNIDVPMDLTTQYVIVVLVFMVAAGGIVGYYFWKKSEAEDEKIFKEENYD